MRRLLYINAMCEAPSGEVCRDGVNAACAESFEVVPYNLFYGETHAPEKMGEAFRSGNFAGVLLSGSEKNTTDHDDPWLQQYYAGLRSLLQLPTELSRWQGPPAPVLGICFGHQALACLLGGTTERHAFRIGVETIEPTPEAARFPELAAAAQPQKLIVYHSDHVEKLPPHFVRVLSSSYCVNQAMRHSRYPLLSFQAHPEMSLRSKTESDEPEVWAKIDNEALRRHDGARLLRHIAQTFF